MSSGFQTKQQGAIKQLNQLNGMTIYIVHKKVKNRCEQTENSYDGLSDF